jgi:hypothetical protein
MKKIFAAALLAVPLLTASARAEGFCIPGCGNWRFEAGANFYLRCYNAAYGPGGGGGQAGPWYLYWPLEAHFQTPAMPQYPYWPSQMSLPPSGVGAPYAPSPTPVLPTPQPVAPPGPPLKPAMFHASGYQQVGYYNYSQVPAYWYGR